VIHLAGTVTAKKQAEYFKYNFEAVQDLYACLLRQNWKPKRLHFASSLAATGPSPKDGILTETDQPKPVDDYGRAKLAAENFLLSQNQFPITIFRPCAVIGPMDTNIFNLYKIGKSGFGFVPWGNNQKVSFISVSDLVEAIFQLTNDLSQNHQTYFISHDDSTDTRSLWKEVGKSINKNIKLIPVPKPILYLAMKTNTVYANLFAKPNVFDKKYYDQLNAEGWVCSNNKLKSDHFWEAKQSLSEVVAETAQSYRQAGWL